MQFKMLYISNTSDYIQINLRPYKKYYMQITNIIKNGTFILINLEMEMCKITT